MDLNAQAAVDDRQATPASGDGYRTSFAAQDRYQIDITLSGPWTDGLQGALSRSAERLESIVAGDLQDVTVVIDGFSTAVDDLLIVAKLSAIDGPGGILAQAGPTAVRTANLLPATGVMQFDESDVPALQASAQWNAVVLHEMMHVLGFGTLWAANYLVQEGLYFGRGAAQAYGEALGGRDPVPVPVETDGGPETSGAHWDEATFDAELMAGWIDRGGSPLSRISAAALGDLGYALAPETEWQVEDYLLA